MTNSGYKNIALLLAGMLIGGLVINQLTSESMSESADADNADEPIYWVAPMDASYRRSQPGKSPMGMDLVPVYADQQASSPGTVSIAPNVINNLGVRTAKVRYAMLEQAIQTVGYVQYNEDKLVHIHPRVEGWIDKLHVKAAGDEVELNQPLYALYSPQLINAQEEFLLAVGRNNSSLTQAALARLMALQMPRESIEALRQTRQVQHTIEFRSPQSGVVDNLNIREGYYVKPGKTLMSIGALDEVWVEAEVFERFSPLVQVGQSVTMTLGYLPGKSWQGEVDYLYPSLNEKTRTLRARLRFKNPGKLLQPNMFAQVVIQAPRTERNLLIPIEAAIRTGKQDRVVLALGDGQFKSVEVKLGMVSGRKVEVLSGLLENDEVVISAQFLLDSESSVDSDFMRMQPPTHGSVPEEIQSAVVNGTINQIDIPSRTINISRDAIPKWQRGPATLDFEVTGDLDISQLKVNQSIRFAFEIRQGSFVITELPPLEGNAHD